MTACHKCHSEVLDNVEKCFTCGCYMPPNVRAVDNEEERLALDSRYKKTINALRRKGTLDSVRNFEESVKASSAVINMTLDFLYHFLSDEKALYSTYGLSVEGEIRIPAKEENAKDRGIVDTLLFAGYCKHIRFAALSLDGLGPKSYGPYSIKLREVAIEDRATLLEENSFSFVAKHKLGIGKSIIPSGYRATWGERHKLAVCKLAKRIASGMFDDFPNVLLSSTGNRATDDFIEVHIYGAFNSNAVESVKGRSIDDKERSTDPKKKQEFALIEMIKEFLKNAGKDWVEE